MRIVYRIAAVLLSIAGSVMAQAPINTVPNWNGTDFLTSFGVPDTASYGEVITVAAGTGPLTSFGFEIGWCTAAVTLRGEVYAWNGTQATGTNLFESGSQVVPASSAFQLVTFNVPGSGVTLPAGTYILFATSSKDQTGAVPSACYLGHVNDSVYPGGSFWYMNNGADATQWVTPTLLNPWLNIATDLAFQVNMGATPTPTPTTTGVPAASTTSLLLGFAGVIGIGLLGLYRFRLAR